MFTLRARWRPLAALCHQPWSPSPASAPQLPSAQPVEEEKTPLYRPERFYPARLGEVLAQRYQLATKLGYGSSSTVWLARDLGRWRWRKERYVAVKINASSHHSRANAAANELAIMRRISQANPRHKGWHFVRRLVDSFTLDRHVCLVFEPLREPLWLYARHFVGRVIPADLLKILLQMVLHGLDYLHAECQVIHTDLKPDNIMVRLEDESLLAYHAHDEYRHPLPQKQADGRTIYLSRNNYGPFLRPAGIIQIVDFGLSVLGNEPRDGCIQVDVYRAPEVTLNAGYAYSADIWNLGVIGSSLFDSDESAQLARMAALLGPPPAELLARGQRTALFYRPDGRLKKPELVPDNLTLEDTIHCISGEEKVMFMRFVRRMLKWRPEERSTARELLDDPWLYKDFPQGEPAK